MLNVKNNESDNVVEIVGTLNSLEIVTGTSTKSGRPRDYVRGTAEIKVDQEIDGKMYESIVPVKMFSMKDKKDGSPNGIYDRILSYKDKFLSASAAEDIKQASFVRIGGAKLEENSYYDKNNDTFRTSFQVSGSFINEANKTDEDEVSKYRMTGVVGKMRPELNREGEETGRLIVDMIVFTYGGKANKITMVADGSRKTHIETNWEEGDTVAVTGRIVISHKTTVIKEDQGFGEPIEKRITESVHELVITGGSKTGLEEDMSYDADSVKEALNQRNIDLEAKKTQAKTAKPAKKMADSFGSDDFPF